MYLKFTLALSFGLLAFVLLVVVAISVFRRFSRGRCPGDVERTPNEKEEGNVSKDTGAVRVYKWVEVEEMTSGFTAVIGEGGFSTVYAGGLPGDIFGKEVKSAFKVQRSSERLYRAFLDERDVLLRLRHPNIVRLIGYSHDHDQGVLILEYIPNGTLHDKLHPAQISSSPPLPWPRRMSILFQIATAVDYLHNGSDLQIIHGDITASNVLLDSNLDPKLCDFGSARMGFSAAVLPASAGHLTGSPGYADPHYLRTGIISKKSDVYSFGVLAFEMISGLLAVGSDGRYLTDVMKDRKVEDFVDGAMGGDFDAGELGMVGAMAKRCVGEVGIRPGMGEIVRIMEENVRLI